ncbi:heparinase II/III-family protein, partial [bacterium]|nr:heparinase II/III-family protein [bacterium]
FARPGASVGSFPVNLLFSKEDVPRIAENTKLPMFRAYWESLWQADVTKDGNFLREAFLYAVSGDRRRGELARQEMLKVLKLKRWDVFLEDGEHTLGFLKAGRLTAWMSLGYDWIYDLLSPDERSEILRQIAEKGCVPLHRALYGMRYPESVKGWGFDPEQPYKFDVPDMSRWPVILGHNNFRAVIAGGLALATYTLAGMDARTEEWREFLLDSYYRSAALFEADGSYDEGVSYCNYAMTYLIYLMEVVQRKEGLDLFDAANYPGIMDYNLAMFMPHDLDPGGSVNFGDAATSLSSAVGFWVARRSRDGLSQYVALNYAPTHALFSLLYYDPTVRPTPPAPSTHFRQLNLDWIVTRSGYELSDLVVAMRSGGPANHEHADRNSIILKYGGEILLADQYRPTYDAANPGWFLRTSLAHNTVVIDDAGQQYHQGEEGTNAGKSSATIVRSGQRLDYDFWASDATKAYALVNQDIKSVTRTTLVFPGIPSIIVIDKLIKNNAPSSFATRWFAENRDKKAECSTTNGGFMITRPHAKFFGVCAGEPEVDIRATSLPLPDSIGIYNYVDVAASQRAKDALMIMAGVPLLENEPAPDISILKGERVWSVEIKKDRKRLALEIFDRGALPEFEILTSPN